LKKGEVKIEGSFVKDVVCLVKKGGGKKKIWEGILLKV